MTDHDILHALRNAFRGPYDLDDGRTLYIGPGPGHTVLEVIVIVDQDPRVIHAMKVRPKYVP